MILKVPHSLVAKILAKTCIRIIQLHLQGDAEARKTLRLKNFSSEVCQEFVNEFTNKRTDPSFEGIELRVPFDAPIDCIDQYRIAKDETITSARNDASLKKLVYLETQEGSDSQSTKDFFTIRDSDLLTDSLYVNGSEDIIDTIVNISAIHIDFSSTLLSNLKDFLRTIIKALSKEKIDISTPKFVGFVYSCVATLKNISDPMDKIALSRVVGSNFYQMELFNDEGWFEKENSISSRLKSNYLYSELAKSETQEMDVERELVNLQDTVFVDLNGEDFSPTEQERWKNLCRDYFTDPNFQLRSQIPYFIFNQIFRKQNKGVLLGDLIYKEILESSQDREHDLINLNIIDDLNYNSIEAAHALLDSEPEDEDQLPLKDLLTSKTRKRLERLVTPKASIFFNPLIQISRLLTSFIDASLDNSKTIQLKITLHDMKDHSKESLGLFCFLFARLLKDLSEFSIEINAPVELIVDEQLKVQHDFPILPQDDSDSDKVLVWDGVVMRFDILEQNLHNTFHITRSEFFTWQPDIENLKFFVLWWGLVQEKSFREDIHALKFPSESDVEKFCETLLNGHISASVVIRELLTRGDKVDEFIQEKLSDFSEIRSHYLNEIAGNGLHHDVMSNFVDQFIEIADIVRESCVPQDSWASEPFYLLSSDLITGDSEEAAFVLPSNPVKAQWLSAYLRESYNLSKNAVQLKVTLNQENGDFYFNWIENLSSSQQPTTAVDRSGHLYESHSEKGWGEYMVPIKLSSQTTYSTVAPEPILDEICSKIVQYLHHHPHKIDGLVITIVSKRDGSFSSKLLNKLRKGEFAALKVVVNLITLKENFSNAMSHFDQTDSDNRFSIDGALFPHVELRLYEFNLDSNELKESIRSLETDIAIIPQLLEGGDQYHRAVEKYDDFSSGVQFNPLYDHPISIRDSGRSKISVVLKPEKKDSLIDNWSTLVTRQKDLAPVSSDGKGCDFYEKKINFEEQARFFEILHESCHWVITAERYLKREQLEFLKEKPEIISFKDGIGPGGDYSIIVSSSSGKQFVLSRLEKKLSKIFEGTSEYGESSLAEIASKIYEDAREITPELALDALGVARITEEILGLSVARKTVDNLDSIVPKDGYVAWISLDTYKEWFAGGESSTRADMLKIIFDTSGPILKVKLFVLESKLRKDPKFVEHAVIQVRSTLRLLDSFLTHDQEKKQDSQLWRNQVLKAIRNSGDRAIEAFGKERKKDCKFDLSVADDFTHGRFKLDWIKGLTIQSITSAKTFNSVEQDVQDERIWRIKIGLSGIINSFMDRPPLDKNDLSDFYLDINECSPSINLTDSSSKVQAMNESIENQANGTKLEMIQEPEPDEFLKARYQKILDILSDKLSLPIRSVNWASNPVIEGPSSFLFKVKYQGTNPKDVESKHDALKLYLELDEDQSIHFSIGGGFINIDVPKLENERYFVKAEDLWSDFIRTEGKLIVPLGLDRHGKRVDINFSDSDSPHLLIGGTTGSGKSEALHTILSGMYKFYIEDEVELYLVDPKGTEMEMYQGTKFVNEEIAMFEDEAAKLIQKAVDEMQARFVAFRDLTRKLKSRVPDLPTYNSLSKERLPWLVVVIDEYADITSDRSFKKGFEDSVKRIAQKGRSAGIHLIVATQKPSSEVISTSLRSNLPAQIALRVKGYNESKVIIEESGAEALIGKGDAMYKSQSSTRRVQCGKVDNIGAILN